MARPRKTVGKKTARISGKRCDPAVKQQYIDRSWDEGCGGDIWPMIDKVVLGKEPYRPKPIPEEQLLRDIRRELKLINQRREEIRDGLQMSFDYSVTTILKSIAKKLEQIK